MANRLREGENSGSGGQPAGEGGGQRAVGASAGRAGGAEPTLRHGRGGAGLRRSTGAAAPPGRAPAHGRSRARRQPRARRRRPGRGLVAARRGCRAAGDRPAGTHPARSAGASSPAGSAAASFVCVRGAAAGSPGGLSALPARRRGREGTGREGRRRGKALAGRLSHPRHKVSPTPQGGERRWKRRRALSVTCRAASPSPGERVTAASCSPAARGAERGLRRQRGAAPALCDGQAAAAAGQQRGQTRGSQLRGEEEGPWPHPATPVCPARRFPPMLKNTSLQYGNHTCINCNKRHHVPRESSVLGRWRTGQSIMEESFTGSFLGSKQMKYLLA
ncbi:5E5 antigen-like [Myiozetetes cayanensis]|uniref:5E5 antigen-like n=1 Tax=Myiozetetes cayanensis TaxID=478635 RepID=UPI0021603F5B|nr:5E5 antigen-like [Myiozetetes cayanensis]